MVKLSQRLSPLSKSSKQTVMPFGEWLPDLPDFANPGAIEAKNVIPSRTSYQPFPGLSEQTNALTGVATGAISARDISNNVYFYAGDATKLYESTDNIFTDESKGGGYATAVDDVWEFVQFGQDVIATNFTDPVQEIAVGGGGVGAFADLIASTNKPKAKHLAVVRNFLVLGNTSDVTDGHVSNRIWWSGFNDPTDFDPDATTQSDYEDLTDGGWVQKVVGGTEYGIVFMESRIYRITYEGSPRIFDVYPVDRGRGTPIPNSVVAHGRDIFFISEEGFFRFDGSQSIPIGADRVDKTFWGQFDIANKARVSSAIDSVNKLVAWSFPGAGSVGGASNTLFLYNWAWGRWARVEVDMEILVSSLTQGFTLEGLDTVSTNVDTGFTDSFDSDVWKGGKIRFSAFDLSHRLGYFTGSNLASTLDTGEAQIFSGRRALINEARPLTSADGAAFLNQATLTDPFTTTRGSKTITVNDPSHGLAVRNNVNFSGASYLAGITIDGDYDVQSVIDDDNYTISHKVAAGENLLTRSEEFDDAAWLDPLSKWTVVADSEPGPAELGGALADVITVTAANDGALIRQNVSSDPGTPISYSVWAKVISGTITTFGCDFGDSASQALLGQLQAGEWVRVGAPNLANTTANNWVDMVVEFSTAGGQIALIGAQLEESSSVGVYTRTAATAFPFTSTGGGAVTRTGPVSGLTVSVAGRTSQTDAVTFDSPVNINRYGSCSPRNNDRYHRIRQNTAAGSTWSHAQGIEVTASPMGKK